MDVRLKCIIMFHWKIKFQQINDKNIQLIGYVQCTSNYVHN